MVWAGMLPSTSMAALASSGIYMFWLQLSFEKPAKHPGISLKEQKYIELSIEDNKSKPLSIFSTPWLGTLNSLLLNLVLHP